MKLNSLIGKRVGITVPHKLDTTRRFTYYGTLEEVDDDYIVLRDSDNSEKEVYITHNEILSIRVI